MRTHWTAIRKPPARQAVTSARLWNRTANRVAGSEIIPRSWTDCIALVSIPMTDHLRLQGIRLVTRIALPPVEDTGVCSLGDHIGFQISLIARLSSVMSLALAASWRFDPESIWQ